MKRRRPRSATAQPGGGTIVQDYHPHKDVKSALEGRWR
jgi:hypothetical protein